MTSLRILALEPYGGGSHRAFLDGWSSSSRHRIEMLDLPPHHWKWRMRHAAITFADQVRASGEWELVFASSMLDLATFRGLAPAVARLPTVVYFHENQLTYPTRRADPRDLHFAFTHLTTGLAADALWIASRYHRDELFEALEAMIARMPEPRRLAGVVERLRAKTEIVPQGIVPQAEITRRHPAAARSATRRPGPLRIVWAARWEHDKDPDTFFAALDRLIDEGVGFEVDVLGQSFRDVPPVFARARERLGARVGRWGGLESHDAYRAALARADVFVSTARHEFFGVAAAEACDAGCVPLLPDRLAYPELLAVESSPDFFYRASDDREATAARLAERLLELVERLDGTDDRSALCGDDSDRARRAVERYTWPRLAPRIDRAVEELVARGRLDHPSPSAMLTTPPSASS